jgi:hypothetical protein
MPLLRNKIRRNKQSQFPSTLTLPPLHSQIYASKVLLVAAKAMEGKYVLIICASKTAEGKGRKKAS